MHINFASMIDHMDQQVFDPTFALLKTMPAVSFHVRVDDVGKHVILTRKFGGCANI